MVYGTMEAHGGKLEIHSEINKGTEVLLAFPPFQPPPATEHSPEPQWSHPLASKPMHILLVDDDELLRITVPMMLMALGHEVHTAEGGQEALNRLADGLEVDLVILDMKMPGLDGAQTLPRLLALKPSLRVLLATGYSDQDPLELIAGRSNVMFIQKPFNLQELRDQLIGVASDMA
jgi:DNA-binding NtrC family response regulator